MITGELKNKVDKIWEIFWTGGITNPLEVIEQFNYLLFIKQLDDCLLYTSISCKRQWICEDRRTCDLKRISCISWKCYVSAAEIL